MDREGARDCRFTENANSFVAGIPPGYQRTLYGATETDIRKILGDMGYEFSHELSPRPNNEGKEHPERPILSVRKMIPFKYGNLDRTRSDGKTE